MRDQRELVAGPIEDDEKLAEALGLLRAGDGLAKAKATVARYAEQAGEELAGLPDVPGRRALASLVRARRQADPAKAMEERLEEIGETSRL